MTVEKLSLPSKSNEVQSKINEIIDNMAGTITVDQIYDATSINPQSGVAIAGAGFLTSSDLSNYVTLNTSQKIQAAKAIFGNDVAFGSDTTQKNLLAVISNSNSTAGNWIGRLAVGAKNKTFIMGTYGGICVLGAHSWTNAQEGTGAAWEPVYINPDGDKAVYIGGSPINGKQALMVIQNVNANTTGTVKINRSTNLSNNFKDVACWGDNISKFNNDANYTSVVESTVSGWGFTKNTGTVTSVNNVSPVNGNVTLSIPTDTSDLTNNAGFITSSALSGYATETWVGNQGYITGISSSDVTTALGYTPYSSANPNGYTSNVGTVTSVNNVSPVNGNVTLSIPTVDQTYDPTSANAQSGVAISGAGFSKVTFREWS